MTTNYECNECKGPIRYDARRCRHCGIIFNDTEERIEKEDTKRLITWIAWIVVIVFLIYQCS